MKRILLLLALSVLFFSSYAQSSYYVDGVNGNNNNAGTSLSKAWKTIQKSFDSATAGSTVYIKAGTYKENLVAKRSGTAGNPITFRNYANDVVIIDGTGTTGTTLIEIYNKSYLNFENLTIQNLTKNGAVGILVECPPTGTVTSLHFKKLTIRNIKWTSSASTEPTDNDSAQPFIAYGRGTTAARAITNLTIDSCEFYNNIPGYSEVLSLDGNINGFSITNNVVHDNINIGIYVGGNYGECTVPALDHTRNGVIENNRCYNNVASYATSGGIYADGAQNVVIQRNISYANGYGIEVGCEENGTTTNITVINNLIYNNQESGLAVGGYTTDTEGEVLDCVFRNNTLFQNDALRNGSGEIYVTKASRCTFKNNVFYTNDQNVLFSFEEFDAQLSNSLNYNRWYTPNNNANAITINWKGHPYETFSSYKSGTSQDANSTYGNPALVNATLPTPDLKLQTGSPCINAGDPATVLLSGETDFNGNARVVNTRIDIGAFENSSGVITSTAAEESIALGLSVYPNPASYSIEVKTAQTFTTGTLSISNARGVEMLKQTINSEGTHVDISSLPRGIYSVRLINSQGVEVTKLVKK
jgi:hypothetical protein